MLDTIRSADAPAPRTTQYWEMMGRRAIWHNGWRAVAEHLPGKPYQEDVWALYDTSQDFAENHNLATTDHARLSELQDVWKLEATRNNVFPLDDRNLIELLHYRSPLRSFEKVRLRPGVGHIPLASGMTGCNRSMRVCGRLLPRSGREEGVIISSGNRQGGYVLYVSDNRLMFEHFDGSTETKCASSREVPNSATALGFVLRRIHDRTATVDLFMDDHSVASIGMEKALHQLSYWGADIARCRSTPVSSSSAASRPYPEHLLGEVTIEFLEEETIAAADRKLGVE